MADIFLSYSSTDRERIRPLVAVLEGHGFSIWWDREIVPGTTFEAEIEREIAASRCVVVAWSKSSVDSQWVQGEAAEGLQRGILVPLLLQDVRPPLLFRHHDAADLRNWRGDVDHPELIRLLDGINAVVAGRVQPGVELTRTSAARRRPTRAVTGMLVAAIVLVGAMSFFWRQSAQQPEFNHYSVAVAEFVNQSTGEADYLGFEVARQVRDLLGRLEQVQVASRTSTTALKAVDTISVGELLGARYLIEGSIGGNAQGFEIDVHLVGTQSGLRIWTQRYRGDRERLFDVAHNMALDIAVAMGAEISAVVVSKMQSLASDSPQAVELYLIGSELLLPPNSDPELTQAESAFRRAVLHDPAFANAYAGLCQLYLLRYSDTRDVTFFQQAEKNCDETIRLDNLQVDPHLALGNLYLASGTFQSAIEFFTAAIELAPAAPEPLLGLGQAYEGLGNAERAESWYRSALGRFPAFTRARSLLGALLFKQGRFAEAIPVFARFVELSPQYAAAYVGLGSANFMAGNFEQALDAWQMAQRLQDNVGARLNTGTAYFILGRFSEARDMYERVTQMSPMDPRAWGQLGDANRMMGELASANAAYMKAVELARSLLEVNPQDATTIGQLAGYLAHLQKTEEATRNIDRALALAPRDYYVRYDVAVAYLRLNRFDEARSAIARAIELGYPSHLAEADPQFAEINL